jgi:hypothetical protein
VGGAVGVRGRDRDEGRAARRMGAADAARARRAAAGAAAARRRRQVARAAVGGPGRAQIPGRLFDAAGRGGPRIAARGAPAATRVPPGRPGGARGRGGVPRAAGAAGELAAGPRSNPPLRALPASRPAPAAPGSPSRAAPHLWGAMVRHQQRLARAAPPGGARGGVGAGRVPIAFGDQLPPPRAPGRPPRWRVGTSARLRARLSRRRGPGAARRRDACPGSHLSPPDWSMAPPGTPTSLRTALMADCHAPARSWVGRSARAPAPCAF